MKFFLWPCVGGTELTPHHPNPAEVLSSFSSHRSLTSDARMSMAMLMSLRSEVATTFAVVGCVTRVKHEERAEKKKVFLNKLFKIVNNCFCCGISLGFDALILS